MHTEQMKTKQTEATAMMVCQEQKQMKERRRKNEPVLLLCFFERVCCYFDGKMGRRCRPEQNFSLKIP